MPLHFDGSLYRSYLAPARDATTFYRLPVPKLPGTRKGCHYILSSPCTEVTWHPQGMPLHFVCSLYRSTAYFLAYRPLWRGDMSSKLPVINTAVQTVWRATR